MVSTSALIQALAAQFAQARQGRAAGGGSFLPGPLGAGQDGQNSVVGNPLGTGGIAAGGIPGTATTGAGIAAGIGGEGAGGDPLAQQVAAFSGFNNNEPGERGDLGAGVTGFDRDLMLSILSGNPLLMAAAIARSVQGELSPKGFGADATEGSTFQFNGDTSDPGLSLGSNAGVNFGSNPLTNPSGGVSFGRRNGSGGSSGAGGGNSRQFDTPEFGV